MTATLSFEGAESAPDQLERRADKLAGGLRELGLRAGDVVAVLLRNDPVYVDIMLACRLGGFQFCPLNWHFTPSELAHIVEDCGAEAVIGHADLLEAARTALPGALTVLAVPHGGSGASGDGTGGRALSQEGGGALPHDQGQALPYGLGQALPYESWLEQQEPYRGPLVSPGGHMVYTSGTTGRPKGVVRTPVPVAEIDAFRTRMLAVIEQVYGLRAGCRALMTAPLYHSAPSMYAQYGALVADLLVIAPRFDAEQTLALVERHRIDSLYCVPTMYVRLLKLPREVRERYDLSSLRFVGSTGAPCAPEVKKALIDWLGPIVHETYASSETGYITLIDSAEALARPGSVGRPLGDAQIRVVGDDGKECAPGEAGILYVRQPAHTDFTYRGRPEAREEVGLDGLVSVGDIGYLDEDGYLYVCDRAVDMVISGGVNIYPAEIEAALLTLPGVLDCAVFGVPDPEFGERLHALVLPEPGAAPDPAQLRDALRATLAGFKIPRGIDLVTDLPRDPNGKLAKHRIRSRYLEEVPGRP
ncbi:AMP-binding protein [Streptomyces candidus]|uniref:Long-chain acyl-CoA synthetase n=1 Tax=Streptomyces candidus TaxID=67283 RepID=A0A7X0LSJ4_9ACTN|nr:AMP-binding protein [Streptomyces candidus]MBB6439320.1 long-chain acyl-CoA synthetase [Streptomyces candidus]GHH42375.1 acyl-CoA synthetase [Streptomyces candidus]